MRDAPDLGGFERQRLVLPVSDGSGDRLSGCLDIPLETPDRSAPLILLIHGMTGCEDSGHIRRSAAAFLHAGYRVLRLNLRGAGPSRYSCAGHYHAGRGSDIADALEALPRDQVRCGVFAIGISLGGAVLVNYLGTHGRSGPVLGAATVSMPIDLEAASRCLMKRGNLVYHRYLLDRAKKGSLGEDRPLGDAEQAHIAGARTIWEYDDRFIAPYHGFENALDYYRQCSPKNFLGDVEVPLWVFYARDDPIVPSRAYRAFGWGANRHLRPLVTEKGGHVGFHEKGGGVWFNRVLLQILSDLRG